MSRRVEITVPNDWALPVKKILEDSDKCNFSSSSEKPHMVVELKGVEKTVFLVTIPGPAVGPTLEILRKNGIGTNVGRIILCSLDFLKPDLNKPLVALDATEDGMSSDPNSPKPTDGKNAKKKPAPLSGFSHFQKARKTTEEMYNDISNGANMNINTWMNLIGASTMAAGGSTTGVMVFTVAAMLVSPIMGPILGITLGYRVADWPLFKTGVINELKMALTCYVIGAFFGIILGDVGNTYKWPNSQMMPEGQGFNLIISIIVSAAAGMVLGVSLTSTGGNALVGTAISAGLLPPLVNAGMLMAYSMIYATHDQRSDFYEIGVYNILFYFTHVVVIVIVSNIIFWLKDIDPRFREGEDSNFHDVPTLMEHKQRLMAQGKEYTEKDKAEFFFEHIKEDLTNDVKELASNIKGKAMGFANIISGGNVGGNNRYRRTSTTADGDDDNGNEAEVHNPMSSGASGRNNASAKSARKKVNFEEEGDIEMHTSQSGKHRYANEDESTRNVTSTNSTTSSTIDPKQGVINFYRTYNPQKIESGEVGDILTRYEGKEEQLLRLLHKQYKIPF